MIGLAMMLLTVTAVKSAAVFSDPMNGILFPKAIPGAKVDYTITVTNGTLGALDNNKTILTDAVPANTKLCLADLGLAGSGPIDFTPGLSNLTYVFTALGNTSDDLDFSSDGGANFTYSPTADADGCDAAITNIRVKTRGKLASVTSASIRFRVQLK